MDGIRQPQGRRDVTLVDNVLFGADQAVAKWVADRIPGYNFTDGTRALAIVKDKKMAAGVCYDNWNGVHIEAAIAAEPGIAWANRTALHHMFYYPFVQLGCEAISVSVAMSNLKSLNLATKLGFEREAIIGFAAQDGGPLLILKMFRDHCRWIRPDGKKQRQRAGGT